MKIPEEALELWQRAGLVAADAAVEPGGAGYAAHTLTLAGHRTVFRAAKTTPTKAGQFATLWQRSVKGPIRPFDLADGVALFAILAGTGTGRGMFLFPPAELAGRKVLSVDGQGGKRALRLYPPQVPTSSAQARRSQQWQCRHFLPLDAPTGQLREVFAAHFPP
ncbi:MepB family protein [Specibacter sp. NPDC057265]|uniref:MepB family protein n=1 Tax=Specibacter sp. NPDC057265 TaxID=3346075 RepID=UPI003645D06E